MSGATLPSATTLSLCRTASGETVVAVPEAVVNRARLGGLVLPPYVQSAVVPVGDEPTRLTTVAPVHHDALVAWAAEQKVPLDALPPALRRLLARPAEVFPVDQKRLAGLGTYAALKPHQRAAVAFALRRGRALNGSEMGTGKTLTTICVLEYLEQDPATRRQLVLCPASLRRNWEAEFAKFRPGLTVTVVKKVAQELPPTGVHVMSFTTMAARAKQKIPWLKYQVLVVDECHQLLNNHTSARAKVAYRLAKRVGRAFLLSGTPISRSREAYGALRVLDPVTFGKFHPFRGRVARADREAYFFANRYCAPTKVYLGRGQMAFRFEGNTLPLELHALLARFMYRVTKAVSMAHLPRKSVHRVCLGAVAELDLAGELAKIEAVREKQGSRAADTALMALVRESSLLKLPLLQNYVRDTLLPVATEKVLLFAHHQVVLNALEEVLVAAGAPFIRIEGRTPVDKRQALVAQFQEDAATRFAVLSLRAAGTGLNLFRATRVVFCELTWSDKDHAQAEDRAHRMGQTRPVRVEYLVASGTTDDMIWGSLRKKKRTVASVVDNALKRAPRKRKAAPVPAWLDE